MLLGVLLIHNLLELSYVCVCEQIQLINIDGVWSKGGTVISYEK